MREYFFTRFIHPQDGGEEVSQLSPIPLAESEPHSAGPRGLLTQLHPQLPPQQGQRELHRGKCLCDPEGTACLQHRVPRPLGAVPIAQLSGAWHGHFDRGAAGDGQVLPEAVLLGQGHHIPGDAARAARHAGLARGLPPKVLRGRNSGELQCYARGVKKQLSFN